MWSKLSGHANLMVLHCFEIQSPQRLWRHLYQQGHLELRIAQSAQHFLGGQVMKLNPHAGIRFLKTSQRTREQFHRQRRRVADVDFATLSVRNRFYHLHRFVGSLHNAAKVIRLLHQGQKRLVFCDSRSRVEQLSLLLRQDGVDTFVSHSSPGWQVIMPLGSVNPSGLFLT